MKLRSLQAFIGPDLMKKMVFIGGPRQVGKTTLAKSVAERFRSSAYLNWDLRDHQAQIQKGSWAPGTECLIFDEIHKYRGWKSHIKGLWDTRTGDEKMMVTGSSRLDTYRRGGDSLQGRYHYYRLHPFTVRELAAPYRSVPPFSEDPPVLEFAESFPALEQLFRFGGFPEPFLAGSVRTLRRWHRERFERVFREDIRSVENVHMISQLELLAAMIPERIASPLSLASVARDMDVHPRTVKQWIDLLARNYYLFRVPPWSRRLARALKKESKYYLWDWSELKEEGPRFENMIASHLLKWCHLVQDAYGIDASLYYLRDREKREVDFLVAWDGKPWLMVEAKLSSPGSFRPLSYFGEKLDVRERYCVTYDGRRDYIDRDAGVRVMPAAKFLMQLF